MNTEKYYTLLLVKAYNLQLKARMLKFRLENDLGSESVLEKVKSDLNELQHIDAVVSFIEDNDPIKVKE